MKKAKNPNPCRWKPMIVTPIRIAVDKLKVNTLPLRLLININYYYS